MKPFFYILTMMLLGGILRAEMSINRIGPGPNVLNTTDFSVHPSPVIADPWRLIAGVVVKVDGTWVAVSGTVAQVHPNEGIRVNGAIEGVYQDKDFFLVNYPYQVGEGDTLPNDSIYLVKPAGLYTYSTAAGSTRTIRKYDYGTPCAEPSKSPEQIEAEHKLDAKRKAQGAAAALKLNQEQAAKGEAYGQLRMAERYRDGDGVETNLVTAKLLFIASANQGDATAARELALLTNSLQKLTIMKP